MRLTRYDMIDFTGPKTTRKTGENIVWLKKFKMIFYSKNQWL
jgi:hypothetical protein